MNGDPVSRESLKNFYGYKETFGRGPVEMLRHIAGDAPLRPLIWEPQEISVQAMVQHQQGS